jgi:hypothetical protein
LTTLIRSVNVKNVLGDIIAYNGRTGRIFPPIFLK